MATQERAAASSTFHKDVSIKVDDSDIGAASISPSGRDVVLASKSGLFIIDLDSPYSPPRHIVYRTQWDVADVQWSPFACRPGRIATTANQKALIFNLELARAHKPEFTLPAHERAITDINFSAHHPDVLATCAVDSFVYTWDLRVGPSIQQRLFWKPSFAVADFEAGATQVKWNRQNEHIMASSHDKHLRIWDTRNGARPLTTITAHYTKIYGIDWHRTDASKILTCGLDKTIKQWENVGIEAEITNPRRVIRALHPIRRARHTPFPNGILAMPQRGTSALSLYTHASGRPEPNQSITPPAHVFQAHEEDARVQEFLWRTRGSFDDGHDNREFQLVSWGSDKHLHLYKVTPELLADSVRFRKGDPITEAPSTTRKGAKYITYRDGPPKLVAAARPGPAIQQPKQQGTLSSLLSNLHLFGTSSSSAVSGAQRTSMTAERLRNDAFGPVVTTMKPMNEVKVGERSKGKPIDGQGQTARDGEYRWTMHNDLAAEVAHVGSKYTKVDFECLEIPDRRIVVSFQGPWGEPDTSTDRRSERKLVFLRLTIMFPKDYPNLSADPTEDPGQDDVMMPNPLQIEFHKTTAAIDDSTLAKLKQDMLHIANHRAAHGREALDAIICYGLGERDLEDSLIITDETQEDDHVKEMAQLPVEESSSEDDEDEDHSGIYHNEAMNSSLTNANVPLPIQATTRWSVSGQLVLARIPQLTANHPLESSNGSAIRLARLPAQALTRNEIFESFGRLQIPHGYDSGSPTSSTGSWDWDSSPSTSSQSDDGDGPPQTSFQPPIAWQTPALRLHSRTSHPSSIGASKAVKAKSVVTILASPAEEFVPSKRCLAEGYRIFGDGPQVCSHNAHVARSFGFEDLADIWELCRMILNNEVPLDILPQQHRRERVLVLARRALVRIKRKDSGLDLQFDEADTVTNPPLKGRIKWGHHSVATWLIPALFDHFERLADTQMLAMLSCVFSEPAAREGVTSAMAKLRHSHLPMAMEAPAFSLDYFPSADAAWSLFKSSISIPSTPAHSRFATPVNDWQRLTKALDTFGSHGSSNGPWGSDTVPSEPVTPYSTGNTPPNLSRVPTARSTAPHTPFSTSPEQSNVLKKSSTANFASAFASLSRPFANAISSSPPVKIRNEGDISTSAPTSGVTWGTTTFYNSESTERNVTTPRAKSGKRASFGHADRVNINYYSDSDSEYDDDALFDAVSDTAPVTPSAGEEKSNIRITLKNQDQFDDEACVSAPLLDMSKEWLYHAWRNQYAEMLGSWGLISQRAEILKFNGLTSYFPPDDSQTTSKAGSMHLGLRGNGSDTPTLLSRTSSTLAPQALTPSHRRSPLASPNRFSFNPEATEFQPRGSLEPDLLAPPPDVFISSQQYLRLSIPRAQPEEEIRGAIFDTTPGEGKSPRPRPVMSRTMSKPSPIAGRKAKKDEPIYTCSICWIRVSGRFLLCPSCGHVAHFDCMDTGTTPNSDEGVHLATHIRDEGDCVVGCGCGCGFDDDEQPTQHELELRRTASRRTPRDARDKNSAQEVDDYFRRWEERGGWGLQDVHEDVAPEAPSGFEEAYGHLGTSYSPKDERKGKVGLIRKGFRRTMSAR